MRGLIRRQGSVSHLAGVQLAAMATSGVWEQKDVAGKHIHTRRHTHTHIHTGKHEVTLFI